MKTNEMKTEFIATERGILSDDQAVVVGRELTKLEKKAGAITPNLVVDVAREEASPLHKYFEWDDGKAAEAHRLAQARQLIRSVSVVTIEQEEQAPKMVRAFSNVNSIEGEGRFDGRVYRSTIKAMREDGYRQQILEKAYGELVSWRERYKHLEEFSNIIGAIEDLEVV